MACTIPDLEIASQQYVCQNTVTQHFRIMPYAQNPSTNVEVYTVGFLEGHLEGEEEVISDGNPDDERVVPHEESGASESRRGM